MPTSDGVHIALEGIAHVLSDMTLRVPQYQRSYAWEERHVRDLYSDLSTAISDGLSEYYPGSIVISRRGSGCPELVDGQQRLATTMILIAAIRDYFFDTGDREDHKRARQIESTYLAKQELESLELTPRLLLNEHDNDFFAKRVIPSPDCRESVEATALSHKRLLTAIELARTHVHNIIAGAPSPRKVLCGWIDYLLNNAKVITFVLPWHANPFTIFETLNDRGIPLTISDKLKNYLFALSKDRLIETEERWYSMVGALKAVDSEQLLVDYIRHLLSSTHGVTREREVYPKIKEHVRTQQQSITFASELSRNAMKYAAIISPQHETWQAFGGAASQYM